MNKNVYINVQGNISQGSNEDPLKMASSQSTISRVKQAKHAAISKAIKEGLTKEEIEEETRYILVMHQG